MLLPLNPTLSHVQYFYFEVATHLTAFLKAQQNAVEKEVEAKAKKKNPIGTRT